MHIYFPEGYLGFLSNERTVYVPHSLLRQCSGLKGVPHITFDHHSRIARDVQYSSTVPLSLLRTVLHPKRVQNALFHSMWIFSAILQANNTYNISS